MKKIKITESQYYKLILEDNTFEDDGVDNSPIDNDFQDMTSENLDPLETGVIDGNAYSGNDIIENEEELENIFESIQKTKGGLNVRNLLLEDEKIKGEYQSTYGQWYDIQWNIEGKPLMESNKYNELIYSIKLDEAANKHSFSTKERENLADKKEALPDGSFPIRNKQDLKDAIKSFGRAKDKTIVKAWIKKRARELKAQDLIPKTW